MNRANNVGTADIENLVAALELLVVIKGWGMLLKHRAHGAVGDDNAGGERIHEGARTLRERCLSHDIKSRVGNMVKNSATVPPALRGARRLAVIVMIVGVAAAAAVGIFVVLTGDFDDTTAKILLTTAVVALFSATALCHLAVATRPVRFVGYIGLAASAVALLVALILTWVDWQENWDLQGNWGKALGVAGLLALFLAQANLLLLLAGRRHPAVRWSLYVTFVAIAGVYGMLLAPILSDGEFPPADFGETYWRIFGVVAILDALGTVVLPVLGSVLRGRESDTRRLTVAIPLGVYAQLADEARSQGQRVDELVLARLAEPVSRPANTAAKKPPSKPSSTRPSPSPGNP